LEVVQAFLVVALVLVLVADLAFLALVVDLVVVLAADLAFLVA
jgi:hypothetical protein